MPNGKSSETIQNLTAKKNGIEITTDKKVYFISDDTYTEGFFYPGKTLRPEEKKILQEGTREKKAKDYLSLLFSKGRYTYKEAQDKLSRKFKTLSEKDKARLLMPYLQADILNDREYAREYAESKTESGWGEEKIVFQLKNKGISEDILKDASVQDALRKDHSEILDALVRKLSLSYRNKPESKRKETIRMALLRRGYHKEEIEKALLRWESGQTEEEKEEEKRRYQETLSREAKRYYESLSRRKSDDLRKEKDRFIRYLMGKGYAYPDIMNIIHKEGYYR